ncbi:hypothetical protein GUITHDRAFT_140441 [Guillardia theta CCMP2712]|uniref:USP domain-containing protein n=1 Tax=Guillardia theta (strain CCMP2712) TaxID=905079 RepID=L1J4Z2_GUITC|nr:hypothetical protein GUITHDRAFT_140441 [Guillardia theta CCMP2712]EKX43382.1 hypothetical protein GUITHDRAFT_140441 [Guillardia theta CCMP2712]|eukprot:XP_005830362.1 hypothetical protein GUITHDRAFT_140441 [Guillardia theta CCMP2712]
MFSKIDDECCEPELLAKVSVPLFCSSHRHARSFVEETFVGRLRYQLKCTECHETFSRRVKFRYLSLFLDSGIFDVQDSLSHMFSSSSRISDAALACPACNSTNIIMLLSVNGSTRAAGHLTFLVSSITMSTGGSNATYQLYAVIVHDKSSKHKYVVYVKNKSSRSVKDP